jgi:preprotein translocase subunit SecA
MQLIQDKAAFAAAFPITLEEGMDERSALSKVLEGFRQKIFFQRQLLTTFRPELNVAEKAQNVLSEVVRSLMIRKIDSLWQEHLLHIDHLRSDVHMRTVGQKDPLLEFKHESFALFERFSIRLKEEIARDLFRFEMMPQPPAEPTTRKRRTPTQMIGG